MASQRFEPISEFTSSSGRAFIDSLGHFRALSDGLRVWVTAHGSESLELDVRDGVRRFLGQKVDKSLVQVKEEDTRMIELEKLGVKIPKKLVQNTQRTQSKAESNVVVSDLSWGQPKRYTNGIEISLLSVTTDRGLLVFALTRHPEKVRDWWARVTPLMLPYE